MAFSVNPVKQITIHDGTTTVGVTGASPDINNFGYRGIHLTLQATGKTGSSPTLDVKLQAKDNVSGNYYDIHGAAFAQVTDNQTAPVYLSVYPGIAETSNQTVSDIIPKTVRVYHTVSGTGAAWSLDVGAIMVP